MITQTNTRQRIIESLSTLDIIEMNKVLEFIKTNLEENQPGQPEKKKALKQINDALKGNFSHFI